MAEARPGGRRAAATCRPAPRRQPAGRATTVTAARRHSAAAAAAATAPRCIFTVSGALRQQINWCSLGPSAVAAGRHVSAADCRPAVTRPRRRDGRDAARIVMRRLVSQQGGRWARSSRPLSPGHPPPPADMMNGRRAPLQGSTTSDSAGAVLRAVPLRRRPCRYAAAAMERT